MPTPEEMQTQFNDEQDRRARQDFAIGNRRTPLSNNILYLLGDLLQTQTTGFDHVNLDMGFTQFNKLDLYEVENDSFLINYFHIFGLKKNEIIQRNKLVTFCIARRSLNAKSMELFNSTTTQQKQEFHDKTEKKTGFNKLFGGKTKEDGQP